MSANQLASSTKRNRTSAIEVQLLNPEVLDSRTYHVEPAIECDATVLGADLLHLRKTEGDRRVYRFLPVAHWSNSFVVLTLHNQLVV